MNAIERTLCEVPAFLDDLAYGDLSTPGTRERQDACRRRRRDAPQLEDVSE